MALEGGSASPEVIDPLMRAAHSLKGAARIVGLDAAVRVAHVMEDCFVAAQKGKLVLQSGHVDILLRGVDLLVQVAQLGDAELEPWQSEHAGSIDALVADLTAIKEGRAAVHHQPSPPVPAPPIAEVVPSPVPGRGGWSRRRERIGCCGCSALPCPHREGRDSWRTLSRGAGRLAIGIENTNGSCG